MGKKITDMIGRRFGRWIVVAEASERGSNGDIRYLCRCKCGAEKTVSGATLRRGQTTSCGCYNHDVITKFGKAIYKEKLYSVWSGIKSRCNNPNDKAYPNYGGRGIRMDETWMTSYLEFKAWAADNGYRQGLWIERIDNDGNYCPTNCRWATTKEQARNKRTNVYVRYGGEEMCIVDAADKSGIKGCTIKQRMRLGWPDDKLFVPVQEKYSHPEAIKRGIAAKTAIK